jgi:hypothetical protein
MSKEKKFASSHWLYGDSRKIEVLENDDCSVCIHRKVCGLEMERRCGNYCFGTSEYSGCSSCVNRYAKYDNKQSVACFICDSFIHKDSVELPVNTEK